MMYVTGRINKQLIGENQPLLSLASIRAWEGDPAGFFAQGKPGKVLGGETEAAVLSLEEAGVLMQAFEGRLRKDWDPASAQVTRGVLLETDPEPLGSQSEQDTWCSTQTQIQS